MEMVPAQIDTQLNQLRTIIPADKQLSWMQLCNAKQTFMSELEKKELALQQLLLNYETFDLLKLQTAIEDYKKQIKEMPEYRKGYTKYLDKIYDELMMPEKRAAAYDGLTKAIARYNQLRVEKQDADKKSEDKRFEQERFKTHVKNEYARLVTEYKMSLQKTITDAYVMALNAEELTEDGIKQFIDVASQCLDDTKVGTPTKFDYTLNTKEEIGALYVTVEAPNFNEILQTAKAFIPEKFKLVHNDRANKQAASEFQKKQLEESKTRLEEALKNTTAVNQLTTNASATQIVSNDGIKEIKRKTIIVVDDDSPEWAAKIVATFSMNWSKASQFVRVKKWGNLSISQMAVALDDAEIRVDGVEYAEVVK